MPGLKFAITIFCLWLSTGVKQDAAEIPPLTKETNSSYTSFVGFKLLQAEENNNPLKLLSYIISKKKKNVN